MATKKTKPTVVLTIADLPKLTKKHRKKIAQFLRSRANVVEKFSDLQVLDYANRFRQHLFLA